MNFINFSKRLYVKDDTSVTFSKEILVSYSFVYGTFHLNLFVQISIHIDTNMSF